MGSDRGERYGKGSIGGFILGTGAWLFYYTQSAVANLT